MPPLTWGEAMIAATYIFFVLFWLYGVVPHEFLNWADSELAWRPDKKVIGPEGSWASWWGFWQKIPLTIHLQIIRDVIVDLALRRRPRWSHLGLRVLERP